MTDNTATYAHECEIYTAGACGWKKNGLAFESSNEEGRPMSASKCIYDAGGLYAGRHPDSCLTRSILLGARKNP